MGGRSKQTVGYRYFFGIHMGAGRGPLDELVQIKVGDRVAWSGSVTANASVQISEPDLFGGDDKEGGIVGQLDVMMGAPTQPLNTRLAAMLGGLVPAFRGVTTTFFDGMMCSGSPYPKPWSFRWRRALQGWDGAAWYPEKAVIALTGPAGEPIKAMNPAHILYECCTNADWGRGLARAWLNDAAWRAAADKLYSEGFGLCLKWSRQDAISTFTQGVVNHIGGALYVDPSSGLVVLKLVRDDYVVNDLPLFDADSGLLAIDDDDAGSQASGVNEVVVRWRSPVDGKDRSSRVKNPAAIHALGAVSSTTKDYPGIPSAELALRVAQRDLRASAGFVKKFKVRLDRRGYQVLPGAVFRVRDLVRGIASIVLRAGRVEHGTLSEGAITITAAQDVFGLPATSYVNPQAGGWVSPNAAPQPVLDFRLVEVPYRDLVATALAMPAAGGGFLAAVAAAPTPVSQSFELRVRPGSTGPFVLRSEGPFCPTVTLAAAMGPATTAVSLAGVEGLFTVAIGAAALLDDEVVRLDSIDLGAATAVIARGCGDTVPAAHAAGARLFFYEDHGAVDTAEYLPAAVVWAKLLTRTGARVLAEGSATAASLTLAGRAGKPYPPADLRVDAQRYPVSVTTVFLALAWRHRSRVLQADQLVDTLAADIGPEAGTSYSWRLLTSPGGSVVASGSAVAGVAALLEAQPSGNYRIEAWSVRGGAASFQRAAHTFAWVQTGTYAARTVTLGGTFTSGVVVAVAATTTVAVAPGLVALAAYTTTVGDASLAGAAASLASAINGTAGFTAAAAGAVVTVTGPLGVVYTLGGGVTRNGLGFNLVQQAVAASSGSPYWADMFVGNHVTGVTEPIGSGITFTVHVERPLGTTVATFTYTTTGGAETRYDVMNGLQTNMYASSPLPGLGYSLAVQTAPYGYYFGRFYGPSLSDIYVWASVTSPFTLPISVLSPGVSPVPTALPHVVDVTVLAPPVTGEQYIVTLDAVDYGYTAVGGDDAAAVAAALAALVDALTAFSATSTGATMRVTGATAGVPFSYAGRVVSAMTATFA